ncbi:Gfo/Idh/MocA family protein [Paludisphaera rhizosphaerae]|uniref:Gfo/Idh/MocA family protein n=1 Tax=Paludisphaera rhizosphaerae TaxID=2711216 RepID=UPI001F113925|nr:Gfo/Idh/MocA family oxidoreductase [Paludisphaera rhizosphaerae]
MSESITRRGFVGTAGVAVGAASAFAAPAIGKSGAAAPSERKRLGIIGPGSRGNQLLDTFLKEEDVDVVSVADVDDRHAGDTADRIKKIKECERPETMRDYRAMLDRKDIDAVIIATPDHWHALPTIHAVLAGKDVYVEKPVAHNVAEGRAMIEAGKKTGKIIAVGTQQRSSKHFGKAVDIVRSGQLGKVFWVQTWNYENISPVGMGVYPDSLEAPPYVDYDRWLGPAPSRRFNPNRFHLLFRWFSDYAGGMMSDWGVHLNDIVLWALDAKGPNSVYATGGIETTDDDRDTPDTLQVVYEFPTATLTYSMRKGNGYKFNGNGYGILFCGTDGTLMLNREGYEVIPDKIDEPYGIKLVHGPRENRKITLEPSKEKGDDGQKPHVRNFLDCLASRAKPTSDIEIAHRSTNTCHLGNIAYRVGRKLNWDIEAERFKNDPEADALLSREARKGFELPKI